MSRPSFGAASGGTLAKVREMANHADTRTTRLY